MPPERLPSPTLLATKEQRSPSGRERGDRRSRSPKITPIDPEAGLIWRGPEYPVLESGIYIVRGTSVQGPVWVRNFQRWSVRVEFSLVTEPLRISAFFNLGNDPHGPKVTRQGRFSKAWVIANGERPHTNQRMTPDVFLDGQFFEVEVAACNRDSEGKPKSGAEVYSRITRIISAKLP